MNAPISEIGKLADDSARAAFFGSHPEHRKRETLEILCAEAVNLLRSDLDAAQRLVDSARWLAQDLGGDYSQGRYLRARANLLNFRRDYAAAARSYEAALGHLDEAGDRRQAAITRSSGIVSLISLGRFEQALQWAGEARAVFEELDEPLDLARLDFAVGNILARQDRFGEALDCFRSAHGEFREHGRPYDVGMSLRNIAVCLQDLNDFEAAETAYGEARAYCAEHELPLLVLEAECNLSYLHYLRGEYTRALASFDQAFELSEREGDHHHQALCSLDRAEIYLELNMPGDAAHLAGEASRGFEELGMGYEAAKARTFEALALSRRGDAAGALEVLSEARDIFVAERNRVWPSRIDLHRAHLLHGLGRDREASDLAAGALEALSEVPTLWAACRLLLATLDLASGDPRKARDACREVLDHLALVRSPALELRAHQVRGRAEEALGNLEAAFGAYRDAHLRLEDLRGRLATDELKVAFLEDKLTIYEAMVRLLLDRPRAERRLEEAFAYIEQAKSRSLADLLAFRGQELKSKSRESDRMVESLRRLRGEIRALEVRMQEAEARDRPDSDQRAVALRRASAGKEDELLRTLRSVQLADPEYGSLQAASVIGLEEIRSTLPADTTLLEYFIADDLVYGCALTRDSLEVEPLTPLEKVDEEHRFLRFQFRRLTGDPERVRRMQRIVQAATLGRLGNLYQQLIAPLEQHLKGRRLVIVPHGPLHHVPFHALRNGEEHLCDRFSISYAPSASVFALCGRRRSPADGRALILGVADERAPLIEEEARGVAEALPDALLLLGEEADDAALRRHGPDARLIHIATHGYFRSDNPMFSAIGLGKGRLALFDLYDLDLGAELVVLSGCSTGRSVVRGADELLGLTRGLLYAGARSLMVSLWDVDDRSSAEFMGHFYRYLSAEHEPPDALAKATREMRESYPNPYNWAPFVLVGRPFA